MPRGNKLSKFSKKFRAEYLAEAEQILKQYFTDVKLIDQTWDFNSQTTDGIPYAIEVKSAQTKVINTKSGELWKGRFWIRKAVHDDFSTLAIKENRTPLYLFMQTEANQVKYHILVDYYLIEKMFKERSAVTKFTFQRILADLNKGITNEKTDGQNR